MLLNNETVVRTYRLKYVVYFNVGKLENYASMTALFLPCSLGDEK